jgi:hypothetical protein
VATVKYVAPAPVVVAARLGASREVREGRHQFVVGAISCRRVGFAPAHVENFLARIGIGLTTGTVTPRDIGGVRKAINHRSSAHATASPASRMLGGLSRIHRGGRVGRCFWSRQSVLSFWNPASARIRSVLDGAPSAKVAQPDNPASEAAKRHAARMIPKRARTTVRLSTAGVSSNIDMALALAARIAGDEVAQPIQLGIEYDHSRTGARRGDRAGGAPGRCPAVGHRLGRHKRLGLTMRAGEPFVLQVRSRGPGSHDQILAVCRSAGFSPRVVQEGSQAER